jgi:hypothetical protein
MNRTNSVTFFATATALAFAAPVFAQNASRSLPNHGDSLPRTTSPFAPNATITEGFDTVAGTPPCPAGWTCNNASTPIGASNWFQGNPANFVAQAGAATSSYISANFQNVSGAGTISNWLISPIVQFGTGSQLRFWSRAPDVIGYADRLEIRASTGGTNTGGTNVSTGTINPGLLATTGTCVTPATAPGAGAYPNVWCEYLITNAQGIPASGSGRIAFRYFVTNGGTGANSDLIGIDTFSFVEGASGTAPTFTYTPAAGSVVPFTGGAAPGSTASASIAAAVGTAGTGTGAGATTTTTCTAPAAPFAGFGQTVTAVGAGAISGGPLAGTCTVGAAAVTATLTCSQNTGGVVTPVTWNLSCPAGVAPATFRQAPVLGDQSKLALMLALLGLGIATVGARRRS